MSDAAVRDESLTCCVVVDKFKVTAHELALEAALRGNIKRDKRLGVIFHAHMLFGGHPLDVALVFSRNTIGDPRNSSHILAGVDRNDAPANDPLIFSALHFFFRAMSSEKQQIEIDVAPFSGPRPDELLSSVLQDTALPLRQSTSRIFGCWLFDYTDIDPEVYAEARPIIEKNLRQLYDSGMIRYGSW